MLSQYRKSLFSGYGKRIAILSLLITGITNFQQANADLGVVNLYMRATLVSNACSVSTDSEDQTVNLGTWATKQFVATPSVVPPVRFTINLEDCGAGASSAKVQFDGTPDSSNSGLFALTTGSTANNVGVEIMDRNKNRIAPGWTSISYPLSANASNVSLVFYARYVRAGGAVTAGTANATATFTMEYL